MGYDLLRAIAAVCGRKNLDDMRSNFQTVALILLDLALAAFSLFAALSLRYGVTATTSDLIEVYRSSLPWLLVFRAISLQVFGIYRIATRHTGVRDVQVIGASTIVGSIAFGVFIRFAGAPTFPRSAVIIELLVNFLCVAGIRILYRIVVDERPSVFLNGHNSRTRKILIIGAGARGAALARELRRRAGESLVLVGFLDDDPAKQKLTIHGAPVLGKTQDVRAVVERRDVDEVILAIPSATGMQVRNIISRCEKAPARLRISPGFSEIGSGDQLRTIRDISIEDLLRRPPVHVDLEEIARYLSGERVLITGAGGSIGSELVRQIVAMKPSMMILLGHGENSIFEIEQELIREGHNRPTCVIADIRDYDRLQNVFDEHRPTVVFHAAAHKHVPLMETNVVEAVTNNVLGTRNICRVCSVFGVKQCVVISTDKAVRPSSVMGASKRAAEFVVRLESLKSRTDFATVRFGNVLGSRGSVVQVMRKQIERGGPVTVTHPDVVRYFMTIPEAVQLVIQAGALGGGGGVYLLDMGEPVKILDLARDLIRLSGLVPEKDIEIEITGLRPGEKLFEEMLTEEEGASVTKHERIFSAPATPLNRPTLTEDLDSMIAAAVSGRSIECLKLLRELVPMFDLSGNSQFDSNHAAVSANVYRYQEID